MSTPYAYFHKQIVPLSEAKIGIMTHAFNYGTGVFEGIRGNWNADDNTIYLFKVEEHLKRLRQSARICRIEISETDAQLSELIKQVVGKSEIREDQYARPLAYKSSEVLGVRVHDLEDDLLIFVAPFGPYLDIDAGARVQTSPWRRGEDPSIPARAKNTGIYINSALAKTEAILNGFDEAIMLNADGHVSEGSGENVVIVPPVREVDRRPVGNGAIGAITKQLQKRYFDIIYGRVDKYAHWCTPVPLRQAVRQA